MSDGLAVIVVRDSDPDAEHGDAVVTSVQEPSLQSLDRREDFPVEVFRYLEARLQAIRNSVMDVAAELSDAESDKSCEFYRVGRVHVDRAFVEVLKALYAEVFEPADDVH